MPPSSVRILGFSPPFLAPYNMAVAEVARERKYLAAVEPFTLEETSAYLKHIERCGGVLVLAVDDAQSVIGWCDIVPKPYEGMRHVGVLGMGVLREHRGNGIGRTLLERAIADIVRRGVRKVELEVFASNIPAVRFYERAGFHQEGLRRNARLLDGVSDDIILMGKELTAP